MREQYVNLIFASPLLEILMRDYCFSLSLSVLTVFDLK